MLNCTSTPPLGAGPWRCRVSAKDSEVWKLVVMSLSPAEPVAVRVPKEALPDALAEELENGKLSAQLALLEAMGWLFDVELTAGS